MTLINQSDLRSIILNFVNRLGEDIPSYVLLLKTYTQKTATNTSAQRADGRTVLSPLHSELWNEVWR